MSIPVETEFRYLAGDGFQPVGGGFAVDGFSLISSSEPYMQCDVFYDAAGLPLRKAGVNLRLRTKSSGQRLVTMKAKLGADRGAVSVRDELEHPLVGELVDADAFGEAARRAGVAAKKLRPMFQITTLRTDHRLADAAGVEIVLSEDLVTYPDGSTEQRVELELPDGAALDVDALGAALEAVYPGLGAAGRGKRSEAMRRLPDPR